MCVSGGFQQLLIRVPKLPFSGRMKDMAGGHNFHCNVSYILSFHLDAILERGLRDREIFAWPVPTQQFF